MRPLARLRAAWVLLTGTGAAASIAFGLLVFAAVLASLAVPREGSALRTQALQRTLAEAPPSGRTIVGTVGMAGLISTYQPPVQEMATVQADLAARLAEAGVPVASNPPAWSGMNSGYTPVTGAPAAAGGRRAKVQVMYRSALARYSRVVTGRLPVGTSSAGGHTVVQVAVTEPTAARFGLRVGSRLAVGPQMEIQVTGIIQPEHTATSFWTENAGAARPLLEQESAASSYYVGTVFVGPRAVGPLTGLLNPEYMEVTWVLPVQVDGLTADQAGPLLSSINGAIFTGLVISGAISSAPVTVVSQLPSILAPFVAQDRAVAPVLGLMYVGLAVTGAVVVLLSAWLVAERRYAEFALIRARGAARHTLGWQALRASATVAVAGAAAGTALALGLTSGTGNELGWWLAGLTVLVTLAGPVLITVLRHRVPGAVRGGRTDTSRTGRRRTAARRIVIEAGLVVLAIGGLVALRFQSLSAGGLNVYPSAAPVLIAVPAAILVLRGYPVVARALARLAGRSRGVIGFVGLARATRTAAGTTLPAFALVLVLGMVAFSAMVSTAVTRGQVAASWRQVGADAIIVAPQNLAITPAVRRDVAAVPGVTGTAGVVLGSGSLSSGFTVQAVFVNPAKYAAVVDQAPGPAFPLAALTASATGGAFPGAATPAAAQTLGRGTRNLSVGVGPTFPMYVAGRIGGVPGVANGALVVLPLSALGPYPPDPGMLLVSGPNLDTQRLRAVVGRALPGATLTMRATALAALTGAPVPQAAQTILVLGAATAAGFGLVVMLLSLLLSARARDMTLARLATMGLGQGQAQLLTAVETLPEIVAAAVGGIACAVVLAPLVGPSMDLSAFIGAGPRVAVVPDLAVLAASAAGLVLAALLVLAAQAAITYRRGSAGPLRIAE
jgi:putative ABC transport system permease protein